LRMGGGNKRKRSHPVTGTGPTPDNKQIKRAKWMGFQTVNLVNMVNQVNRPGFSVSKGQGGPSNPPQASQSKPTTKSEPSQSKQSQKADERLKSEAPPGSVSAPITIDDDECRLPSPLPTEATPPAAVAVGEPTSGFPVDDDGHWMVGGSKKDQLPPSGFMNYHSFDKPPDDNQQHYGITPMNPKAFKKLIKQFQLGDSELPKRGESSGDSYRGTGRWRDGEDPPRMAKLSRGIWNHFVKGQQKPGTLDQKISLWEELERVLGPRLRGTTHAFGSTLNGFALDSSDMDLCLFVEKGPEELSKKNARKFDLDLLYEARRILIRECRNFVGRIELVPAKVPILKFFDRYGKIEVDMSVNNPVCIRNTNLLYVYSQMDWRVRPLMTAIKAWAKSKGINEAVNQTMSSYLISLMVVHFLQRGIEGPPVLPCLQTAFRDTFHPDSYIFDLPFTTDLPVYRSENGSSLGEIIAGFFNYYANKFDFSKDVGSIRTGKRLDNRYCQDYARQNGLVVGQWDAHICMEEPFDRTNAGRATVKRDKFDLILKSFKEASQEVNREGEKVDFQSIIAPEIQVE